MSDQCNKAPHRRVETVSGEGQNVCLSQELRRLSALEQSASLWPGADACSVCCRLVDTIIKTRWTYRNIELRFAEQTVEWLLAPTSEGEGWPAWAADVPRLMAAGILVRKDLEKLWDEDRSRPSILHYAAFYVFLVHHLKSSFEQGVVDDFIQDAENKRSDVIPAWFPYGLVSYALWHWRSDIAAVTPANLAKFELWWIRGGARELKFPPDGVFDRLAQRDPGPLGQEWHFTIGMRTIFEKDNPVSFGPPDRFSREVPSHADLSRYVGWWLTGGAWENGLAVPALLKRRLDEAPPEPDLARAGFTEGMLAIHRARTKIAQAFPLDTCDSRRGFLGWWLTGGARENNMELTSRLKHNLDEAPVEIDLADAGFSEGMLVIYYARTNIAQSFSLGTHEGRRGFIGWWLTGGARESGLEVTSRLKHKLDEAPPETHLAEAGFTEGMLAIHHARADVARAFPIDTRDGRRGFIGWWLTGGARESGLEVTSRLKHKLDEAPPETHLAEAGFTEGMLAIYHARADIAPAFPIDTRDGRRGFIGWWLIGGASESDIDLAPVLKRKLDEAPPETHLAIAGFTEGMLAIHRARTDIARDFPVDTFEGRRGFIGWWLTGGASQSGMDLAPFLRRKLESLAEERDLARLGFTDHMLVAYQYRRDVACQYAIGTHLGALKFAGWWLLHGCSEFGLDSEDELLRLQSFPEQDQASRFGISTAIAAISAYEGEIVKDEFYLDPWFCRHLFGGWISRRKKDSRGLGLARWQQRLLGSLDPDSDPASCVPLIATAVAANLGEIEVAKQAIQGLKPAVRRVIALVELDPTWGSARAAARFTYGEALGRSAYDLGAATAVMESTAMRRLYDEALHDLPALDTSDAELALVGWQMRHGWHHQGEVPNWCARKIIVPHSAAFDLPFGLVALAAFERMRFRDCPFDDVEDAQRWLEDLDVREPCRYRWITLSRSARAGGCEPWPGFAPGGVQILGWAKGELGIGEDVRMGSRALTAAKVPHIPIDVSRGTLSGREQDETLDSFLGRQPVYACNITFLAAPDHYRQRLQASEGFRDGRYNIGNWVWELPIWPSKLDFVFEAVDEIWAPSRFVETMFSGREVPVLWMPPCVEIDIPEPLERQRFGLDHEHFVFMTTFDVNSSISRKNPQGVIAAFRKAFPADKDVRLIVKAMNGEKDPLKWQSVIDLGKADPRILFINETLPRQESLALLAMVDSFVSMHRAEGFGRNIAEAMLLEKPVLASAFSGNVDFTLEDNCYQIDGVLRPLEKNEYTYWNDQYWMEPSVDDAAAKMRRVFDDRVEARKRAVKGGETIRTLYSAASVGARYRARLTELGFL